MSIRKKRAKGRLNRTLGKWKDVILAGMVLAVVVGGIVLITSLPRFEKVQHTLCVLLDREVDAYDVYLGGRKIGAVEDTDEADTAWNTAVLRLNSGDVSYKIDPMYTTQPSRVRHSRLSSVNLLAASFGLYLEDVLVDYSCAAIALHIGDTLVILEKIDDVYELFTKLAQRELGTEAVALCSGLENGKPQYELSSFPSVRTLSGTPSGAAPADGGNEESKTLEDITFPYEIGYQILYVRENDAVSVQEALEQCADVAVYRVYREIYEREEDPPIEYVRNTGQYEDYERVLNSGRPALVLAEDLVYYSGSAEMDRKGVSTQLLREAQTRYVEKGTMPVPDFYWPALGVITSYFGYREQFGRFHEGLDISNRQGTFVKAAADGIVVKASYNDDGLGNYIIIDHQNHYRTWYGHNYQLLVQEGDHVHQGQIIALMGSTGFSTGPHCHFEIEYNGHVVDPYPLLTKYGYAPQ